MDAAPRATRRLRRRARRLFEEARAALDRAPVADDGLGPLQTAVVGLDPLRVLLFGSGPLTGYGVRTRREAVDGPLAALLAERSGRGVVIETRVRLSLATRDAVTSLGWAGTVTFGAAVWSPRFGAELDRSDAEGSRGAVRAMLRAFRAQSDAPLVVCQLPVPLGLDWRTLLRRPRVARLNRVLEEEAARVPGVVAVATGAYRPSDSVRELTPEWHRRLAERLAPAVLRALGVHDREALEAVAG